MLYAPPLKNKGAGAMKSYKVVEFGKPRGGVKMRSEKAVTSGH